jgi:L-malate glycosyltransferase
MTPMRVLYVNHTSRVSGGELSLLGLLESLPAGVEAAVACPPGELADRLGETKTPVIQIRGTDGSLRLHPLRTPQALAEMASAGLGVRRAAGEFEAELVHANSIRSGLIGLAPAPHRRPPTVVHVRDCMPPGRSTGLVLGVLERAEALIANSDYTRGRLGATGRRAHVVHNAVDLTRFESTREGRGEARGRLGLSGDGPVLAVIAQITPWKGQDDAIEIAAALRRSHPGLRLLVIGATKFDSQATRFDNAAYLRRIRRRVELGSLGETVHFLCERADVPQLLPAVDLLLAPSWEEPFGRSIIEAMAAGVPVAATRSGGPAEIIDDGRTGLLLPPRRPGLWAAKVDALLDSPGRLDEMGRAARLEAHRRFGADRHVDRVLAVYGAVTGGVRRPAAGFAAAA